MTEIITALNYEIYAHSVYSIRFFSWKYLTKYIIPKSVSEFCNGFKPRYVMVVRKWSGNGLISNDLENVYIAWEIFLLIGVLCSQDTLML